MATTTIYLTGTCKWAKVHKPDEKYNKYSIDLYVDDKNRDIIVQSGSQATVKHDADGQYVRIRRNPFSLVKGELKDWGPPTVLDHDGKPLTSNVGNGSKVTCKVVVYDTIKGKGTRLEGIRVDELVEYNKDGDVLVAENVTPF